MDSSGSRGKGEGCGQGPRSRPTEGEDRLAIVLGSRLDMEELWRIRSLAWSAPGLRHLHLEMARVETVAPDALLLLHEELARQERGGVRVTVERLPASLRRRLRLHPILRFTRDDEEIFTDPDLDHLGFRPSRH